MKSFKKKEFLSEFMGSISHDMNEKMSGIFNYLEQVDEDLKEGIEDVDYLDIESIRNKVKIIKKQIEDFSEKVKNVNTYFEDETSFLMNNAAAEDFFDQIKYYNNNFLMKKSCKLNFSKSENLSEVKLKVSEPLLVFLVSKLMKGVVEKCNAKEINVRLEDDNDSLRVEISKETEFENIIDLEFLKELKKSKSNVLFSQEGKSCFLNILKYEK